MLPALGARLHSLRFAGHELLRTPAGPRSHAEDPFFWGAFVMAPWCNRIAPGPLVARRQSEVDLAPNFRDGTAIHGQVYARRMDGRPATPIVRHRSVAARAGRGAIGSSRSSRIERQRLEIVQRLANLDDSPMPGGIGLHPVVRRRPADRHQLGAGLSRRTASRPRSPIAGQRRPGSAPREPHGHRASTPPGSGDAAPGRAVVARTRMHARLAATGVRAPHRGGQPSRYRCASRSSLRRMRRRDFGALLNGEPGRWPCSTRDRLLELLIALESTSNSIWPGSSSPTAVADDADFDALIKAALERLPAEFRRSLGSVAIVVDDYATQKQLRRHRRAGTVRDLPGRAAHGVRCRRRAGGKQDHPVSGAARGPSPGPSRPRRGRRARPSSTRSPTTWASAMLVCASWRLIVGGGRRLVLEQPRTLVEDVGEPAAEPARRRFLGDAFEEPSIAV